MFRRACSILFLTGIFLSGFLQAQLLSTADSSKAAAANKAFIEAIKARDTRTAFSMLNTHMHFDTTKLGDAVRRYGRELHLRPDFKQRQNVQEFSSRFGIVVLFDNHWLDGDSVVVTISVNLALQVGAWRVLRVDFSGTSWQTRPIEVLYADSMNAVVADAIMRNDCRHICGMFAAPTDIDTVLLCKTISDYQPFIGNSRSSYSRHTDLETEYFPDDGPSMMVSVNTWVNGTDTLEVMAYVGISGHEIYLSQLVFSRGDNMLLFPGGAWTKPKAVDDMPPPPPPPAPEMKPRVD